MDTDRRHSPPRAEQRPLEKTLHNVTRIDEFDWLRAADWQDVIREPHRLPQDIRAYLEAENSYTATAMRSTEPMREQLFQEMRGRIAEDDASVPMPDRGRPSVATAARESSGRDADAGI